MDYTKRELLYIRIITALGAILAVLAGWFMPPIWWS